MKNPRLKDNPDFFRTGTGKINPDVLLCGIWLGYPLCCAIQFSKMIITHHHPDWRGKYVPLTGTGCVPCLKCAAEKTDEQLTTEINLARLHPDPFPSADLVVGQMTEIDLENVMKRLRLVASPELFKEMEEVLCNTVYQIKS